MKEYIMFGAGRNAEQIIDGSIGIFTYKYIVDNDEQKQGKTIRGIKIVSPDYLISSDYNGENILISVTRDDVHCAIVEQLQGMGFKYNENFFRR
jgi:FlaA1/EpsC-like NDP-sugar epimerase